MSKMNAEQFDEKVSQLIEEVCVRRSYLEKSQEQIQASWKTNCSFHNPYESNGQPKNIQTATKELVVWMTSIVLSYKNAYQHASDFLNVAVKNEIDGFAVDDWLADFKKRLAIISYKEEKQKLTQLETRLNSLMSEDKKRENELLSILEEMKE